MNEGMFHRLGDFAYARNARQAVGYYLFHLAIGAMGFLLAVLCYKFVVGMPEGTATQLDLAKVASALGMCYVGFLSYKLLEAKHRLGQPKMWAAALFGVVLGMLGMLLGLVVVACLSILRPLPAQDEGDYLSKEEQP